LFFIVGEVCLCLNSLVLDGHFIIELSSHHLCRECPEVLLLAVDHEEYLPRVSIFGDAPELGAAEVLNVVATLEGLFVGDDHDFLWAPGLQAVDKTAPLFQY
jgi:hypothetical protein